MDKKQFLEAISMAKDSAKQRKFKQSIDMAVNFKGIDFKKAENRIDVTASLPFPVKETVKAKIAVFVRDKNFASVIREKVEKVIMEQEIETIGKKQAMSLSEEYDAFFAEGPVMLTVAKYLGQIFAPKGKMPKPVSDPESLAGALKKVPIGVKISNRKGKFMPVVHALVGREDMEEEKIAENSEAVYNAILSKVDSSNIKSVFVKLSMGPPIKVGAKEQRQTGKERKKQKEGEKAEAKKELAKAKTEAKKENAKTKAFDVKKISEDIEKAKKPVKKEGGKK